ncbi:serine/threonine protein kinase [Sedimentibacter sp. zth1]|uniref:serine/threonine-protein kinase n=1 Tax=Sedimentibacter sp. zth1 TaxID=2816908 RepID=UPI001A9372CD|nr:serine/threonine-protein kinase [Sedimentibacter sp. zth1]QSX04833.1 serine/threonine protein kinase [Sedimentibacter sp. zth1]
MIIEDNYFNDTYKIISLLGSGGSGTVYKAYHTRLEKYVVIKEIKNNVNNKFNDRAEVDILKNLRHMYLPQVYDFIKKKNKFYTVMDFIEGKSFCEELKCRKRFPQKKVIKWGIQLCEALDYLHSMQIPIIHSDIKPANIMLTNDDNICLIDFNVSLLFSNAANIVGYTMGYSPPEQRSMFNVCNRLEIKRNLNIDNNKSEHTELLESINYQENQEDTNVCDNNNTVTKTLVFKNVNTICSDFEQLNCGRVTYKNYDKSTRIDNRSDIYSLGITLYKLLTGEMPKFNKSNDCVFDIFNINICKDLKKIIIKAVKYDADERYQNVNELKRDLDKLVYKKM